MSSSEGGSVEVGSVIRWDSGGKMCSSNTAQVMNDEFHKRLNVKASVNHRKLQLPANGRRQIIVSF